MQAISEKHKSREKAERVRLTVEEEVWKSAVLTEWERTCSPPQSEEVCLNCYALFVLTVFVHRLVACSST